MFPVDGEEPAADAEFNPFLADAVEGASEEVAELEAEVGDEAKTEAEVAD